MLGAVDSIGANVGVSVGGIWVGGTSVGCVAVAAACVGSPPSPQAANRKDTRQTRIENEVFFIVFLSKFREIVAIRSQDGMR
jgi:hypothetical protein